MPHGLDVYRRFDCKYLRLLDNECWVWRAARGGYANSYGILGINKRPYYAHRLSLERKIGRRLLPNEFACHACDNPPCVNPAHLFVGSAKINTQDMISKGRRGISPTTKLSWSDSLGVIAMSRSGALQREIATIYGISQSHVSRIIHGVCWAGEDAPTR